MSNLIPATRIEKVVLVLRGYKVLLDIDLAALYGVTTSRLNEQVKRNRERFPIDFMFQLTALEKKKVIANCDHLQSLRFSPSRPFAFTEHGALMAASVLNTPIAVRVSIQVVRAFTRLRELLTTHKDLARKLAAMERKYDSQFQVVFDAIRQLLDPSETEKPKRRLGFAKD